MTKMAKSKRQCGFSTLELMVVIAMTLIVSAVAVPTYLNIARNLRAAGDLRDLNGIVAQAKMRAAADFTHARAYIDLSGNTFHLEVWNKGSSCWKTDTDVSNACTQASSPVIALAQGDTFGFGSVTAGPTAAQSTISQAPACKSTVAGTSPAGGDIANTACIEFNSRGNPVNTSNALTGVDAIYLTNGATVNGVTVSTTGLIQPWSTSAAGTGSSWSHQ